MSSRPPDSALVDWAMAVLAPGHGGPAPQLTPVAGDASYRRYFRLTLPGRSYVLVDAPPATEKNQAFLAVRALLEGQGVRVPALYGADLERGFLVLEDLGDRLLLAELDRDSGESPYAAALAILRRVAALDTRNLALPAYDDALLAEELGRFPDWFVDGLLHCPLDAAEQRLLQDCFGVLIASALEQPRVLVHRDFHSRNLMPQPDGSLAVIDFQDAVLGPVTYDAVSLLRDCYVRWSPDRVDQWALDHLAALRADGLPGAAAPERFLRWFDLMGLQRHIKVLGTFARLYLRDGKAGYLADLPLVIDYVLEISGRHAPGEPAIAAFRQWFEQRLLPAIARQHWSGAR